VINQLRNLVSVAVLIIAPVVPFWAQNTNQDQAPSGGKTSDSAAPKKVTPKSSSAGAKTPKPLRTAVSARGTQTPSAAMESLDGKWWTTGNDFGISEVFFGQKGNIVSGAIMYADGRTGTFSGVLTGKRINFTWTNSSGDGGSGWLEQSWNNFLGGSYRDKKGVSGSWTLGRVAGNWCFGGSRDRIRKVNHGSRGQLFYVTEDGGEEAGYLEGSSIILRSDLGDVKGTMDYKTNRVDFATRTFWTWCGR